MVNSLSVYAFDGAGKPTHIDFYLQMAPPNTAMLKSFEQWCGGSWSSMPAQPGRPPNTGSGL
ncbi:hypothetical protein A4G29_07595 [Mycobacterium kansasii]|nr:hypothetical protein A4G29_07595 [Mycobacterium kansasii]